MRTEFATRRYSFAFHPEKVFEFRSRDFGRPASQAFPCSEDSFRCLIRPCSPGVPDNATKLNELIRSSPALFYGKLDTVRGWWCVICT